MNISAYDIQRIITPLRLIFWGGLLCVLDIKINGFDLLNDFVGILMITWAVFQISTINVHDRYDSAMRFVKIVAVLKCFTIFLSFFSFRTPDVLSIIQSLIGLAAMIATVVFCVAMRWLSLEAELSDSVKSWKTTTLLFILIYMIPLGIFYIATAVAYATGETFSIKLGPQYFIVLLVLFVPLIHFFVSTSRMKNESQWRAGAPG